MGYKYSILGYISVYSNKEFSSLKNDLFDFQMAWLSNDLEFFMWFSAKQFALAAPPVYYDYTEKVKSSKGCNSKVSIQELWFLRSARRLMLVNICMKFHEDTLNSFKVIERTRFCLSNCYLQSSKGHNSKSINTTVMVLAFCTSSNVG